MVVWSSPAMFLMSATCHLFEKRWRESVIIAVAVRHGTCHHSLHFAENPQFACSFRHLSCIAAFCILLYTNTHHQMGQQEEPVLIPAALRGKQFRWAMHEPVWYERSVCFVSVLFFVVFCAVLFHLLY